jgi:hypothetical protein
MSPNNSNRAIPQMHSRPFLCGAIWGLGLGLLISFSIYFSTTLGLAAFGVVFIIGPATCIAAVVAVGVLYSLFARKWPQISSRRFQIGALVGASVLACTPWVVETFGLYSFAYFDIPIYPESRRLETIVRHHPAAKVSVKFSSEAARGEILKFYDRELRTRNWSTSLDASYGVSAQKPTGVLFVYVREREKQIEIEWYRHFSTH